MLKKQTVWLLTMLSLIIVLSVYYVLSPDREDLAFKNDPTSDIEQPSDRDDEGVDVNVTSGSEDEVFTTIRMNIEDERSRTRDRLKDIVASSDATSEEKNDALNTIEQLEKTASKEFILEKMLIAEKEYEDVLVRSDGEKVQVHIKEETLSKEEVDHIMQLVRDEFGDLTVDVIFQEMKATK
ncbi:stage III sporulation protein AH [Cerasibacillus quisquiliarum]|uniref:Stage III sporulation protein AH n=1 Tax=Cerasibacillus quisquiliarum TaxID=227865 RepID=A0A511UWX3_9BACI|nr:SpoIIIAH-like family protein [Cerasibacillus quisquiliarum]MBB5145470.1 stage III sporulation protein AH [Cerasibacillus quisquiliarum]GEN31135.1 stage III sporulation protein AH [Cerasibacillus quisquiliarum]